MPIQFYILSIIAVWGGVYFLALRKPLDFVAIGFFGQLIYFSPAFYGYVANPYFPGILPAVPIFDEAYSVWAACLGATLLTGMIYRPKNNIAGPLVTDPAFDFSLLALLGGSLMYLLIFQGEKIYSADKSEVLENIDRIFLLFSSVCQVSAVCFLIQKKWLHAIPPILGVIFLLYVGFRAEFALAMIAIFAYVAHRFGVMIFLRPRFLFPVLSAAIVLLGYKPFLTAYRLGNWQVLDSLQMSDNLIDTITLQFEPFLTQAVLNETLLRQFQVPSTSLLDAMLAVIPFLAPLLGLKPEDVSFNFQDYLFPNIPYGMTGSPQSQFIAALGWTGLVLFIVAHNLILVALSRGMSARNPAIRLFVLGAGAFFAFYIQRNDLANSLTLINRIVVTIGLAWLVHWLVSAGGRSANIGRGRLQATRKPRIAR